MHQSMKHLRWLAIFALALAITGPIAAQDEEEEEDGEEEPAQPPAPTGPPSVTGRDSATGSVGQLGMIFELSSARLVVPPHLPIGNSRRMTFGTSRQAPRPNDVVAGFHRIGPVLSFDGAIDATSAPVVVSIRQRNDPSRPNLRLVLAMEQPAICNAQHTQRLPSGAQGLCSGWELIDARFADGQLSADMRTPGGFRLTFGSVPIPAQ
jgi:hypothetical protein